MYVFVDGKFISSSAMLNAVYERHKDEDGFLYVSYSDEVVYG